MSTAKRPTTARERRVRRFLREQTRKASDRTTSRGLEPNRPPAPVTLPRISCLEKDFDR